MDVTPTNPELRRRQIEHDLPHLHRERWNRIASELAYKIERSIGAARSGFEHELERHYANRFRPESSRAALLAEAGAGEGE